MPESSFRQVADALATSAFLSRHLAVLACHIAANRISLIAPRSATPRQPGDLLGGGQDMSAFLWEAET